MSQPIQLELFVPTKDELKASIVGIANTWKREPTEYNGAAIRRSIDDGSITTYKEIDDIFMVMRAMWL